MGDETMEHKVTFHIDENARRSLLLGNADNLLRAAADIHMTVEVPANALPYRDMPLSRLPRIPRQPWLISWCLCPPA